MTCTYEEQRNLNIAKNRELLKAIGLDKPFFEPKEKARPGKPPTTKRKFVTDEDSALQPTPKAQRTNSGDVAESNVRRSSRNVGKTIDYKAEQQRGTLVPLTHKSSARASENLRREEGERKHSPKTFGSIPGIEVGTWWESRRGCSTDSIHAPWVAGISGSLDGAYSVALSGGYDDDVDLGYAFTYTGSGGRDLKGTKAAPKNLRTAPQSSDQSFDDRSNRALKRSSDTKKPVRVIRGYKLRSPYAPSEGYRYDGLYLVEKAWMEKGLNAKGYLVCKFAFKRIPGQPPLPVRESIGESPEDKGEGSDGLSEGK